MTPHEAFSYWADKYLKAKDYSDIHWEAQERHEHQRYVEALEVAILAIKKFKFELSEIVNLAQEIVLDETTVNGISIRKWIEYISNGDYQPICHGAWLQVEHEYVCSRCGGAAPLAHNHKHIITTKHCPHCGARMDGDKNDP